MIDKMSKVCHDVLKTFDEAWYMRHFYNLKPNDVNSNLLNIIANLLHAERKGLS